MKTAMMRTALRPQQIRAAVVERLEAPRKGVCRFLANAIVE